MVKDSTNVNLVAVDFDPFAGPEIVRLAPSTEPQIEIWTTCLFGGDDANRAFNESVSLRFNGSLDRQAFAHAWQAVLQRHEALHSAFSADGKQMCVFDALDVDLLYSDYSTKTSAEQVRLIQEYVQQDTLYLFDLVNGPLIKGCLIKLSDTVHHFTLTGHHIVCDGWSLGILLQDLSKLYSASVQQSVPNLPEAPRYSDYAAEQQAFMASAEHRQVEKFWLDQYRGSVPVLDLPTDFARPALRTYDSGRSDYPLEASLALAVKQMGLKAGCSFVTTLLAAFEVFLCRLTGQSDIVVGLPTAGQSATGYLNLVGHCVNLLPLRSFPQPEQSFLQFLKARKEAVLDAYEYQRLTFSSLLNKLAIARDPSRVPLVPVIFNVDMGLDDDVDFFGLTYKLISNPRQFGAVDLFVNISGNVPTNGSGEPMIIEWAYNTQLFKEESIDRMMTEFTHILNELVGNPDVLIEQIQLTNQHEQLKKLAAWNNTKAAYPKNSALPELLTKAAKEYPDRTALIFTNPNTQRPTLTYRELDELANQVAHVIQQHGVGAGTERRVVGVILDRSPEMLITLLAVMKAGAAYVPIDPEYPHDRIAFMLADSLASMLITSTKYHVGGGATYQAGGRLTNQTTVLLIDDVLKSLDGFSKELPERNVSPTDLAYILYTSGSTGQPKGVLIEHRNLVNLLYSMIPWPGITKDDRLLAVTTISFDIAGLELYLPLLVGATLVLADSETTKDGRALLSVSEEQQISIIQATPATYKMMLAAGWEEPLPLKILCCGEPLSKDLAQKITARCDSLWNMYGPTETTIYSTGKQILATDEIITIGRPIQNTQVYILDEQLNPLPEGVVGEIYLAGDGVARGYLNRPELTQEKFVPNPFDTSKKTKMYRTGDLGKFMGDGEIHCLGRIDQQVKIRGYRVELGEVEHALVTQPGVKDVVVMAREDRPGDQRLVAYVVTDPFLTADAFLARVPTWRIKLQDVLPTYMVPSDFVSLEQLPVTPNGKIDRKALPKPASLLSEKGELAAPVTDTEKLIAGIWAEGLGMEKVGIDSDFFELGGHSMIAVQVMTQLEKETGRRLPLSTLLTYPTIRKLAQLVQTEEQPATWKSLVPIRPQGNKVPIYIIHGIGLNLLNFSGLVNYMDPEQPIYGLQARGLDGKEEPLDNMEAIASAYLEEVMQQNPDGPYAIAGYSFGGYVALEMARQIKEMGKDVKLLAMFDTNAQESDSRQDMISWIRRKIFRQFPKMLWVTKSLLRHPMLTIRYQQQYVERQVKALLLATGLQKPPVVEKEFDQLNAIMEKHETAFYNYKMRPYAGIVDLFKAQMRVYFVDDNKFLGWKKYALKGVRVHSVPGDHEMMLLPPNDKVFAEALQKALDNS
ncbi:amino acid adenylation domain-containing protein [Spirosoma sp. BT702]|uniref:Amino acid adenylation domain-containing protein n=1 Tax=Spirosoma profusum TaxID=2771354 RepID=A0A927ASS0_9BACT|nr:non-ribosomal peptide synthetase [Spirosoma profusum]MBD2704308.1 amino acid adenylation domain-containing protein [Spirosoma profusum]